MFLPVTFSVLVFCFSCFLCFTYCGFSTDLLGKNLCQRGEITIPSITHPRQGASPRLQVGFQGVGVEGRKTAFWMGTGKFVGTYGQTQKVSPPMLLTNIWVAPLKAAGSPPGSLNFAFSKGNLLLALLSASLFILASFLPAQRKHCPSFVVNPSPHSLHPTHVHPLLPGVHWRLPLSLGLYGNSSS